MYFSLFSVVATSYGTSYLFHLLIRKYVFKIYKGIDPEVSETETPDCLDSSHLLFEKLSFWGLKRIVSVPVKELIDGGSIFNTWKSTKTNEPFLVQYILPTPTAENSEMPKILSNIPSYNGEPVDQLAMQEVYTHIMLKNK